VRPPAVSSSSRYLDVAAAAPAFVVECRPRSCAGSARDGASTSIHRAVEFGPVAAASSTLRTCLALRATRGVSRSGAARLRQLLSLFDVLEHLLAPAGHAAFVHQPCMARGAHPLSTYGAELRLRVAGLLMARPSAHIIAGRRTHRELLYTPATLTDLMARHGTSPR